MRHRHRVWIVWLACAAAGVVAVLILSGGL